MLLPFRFGHLTDDSGRTLVTSGTGEYAFVPASLLPSLVAGELLPEDPHRDELTAKSFISAADGLPITVRRLASQYRSKKAFIFEGPSLFLFVVTLRCDHSCHYCQVSRRWVAAAGFDMTEANALAAINRLPVAQNNLGIALVNGRQVSGLSDEQLRICYVMGSIDRHWRPDEQHPPVEETKQPALSAPSCRASSRTQRSLGCETRPCRSQRLSLTLGCDYAQLGRRFVQHGWRAALVPMLATLGVVNVGHTKEPPYTPQYERCVRESGGNTFAMRDCTAAELERWDKALNANYKALMASLAPSMQKALTTAQVAWLKFRETNCAFAADRDGGQMAQLAGNSCFLSMTAERTLELKGFHQPYTRH